MDAKKRFRSGKERMRFPLWPIAICAGMMLALNLFGCQRPPLNSPDLDAEADRVIDEYWESVEDSDGNLDEDGSGAGESVQPSRERALEAIMSRRWTIEELNALKENGHDQISCITDNRLDLAIAGVTAETLFVDREGILTPVALVPVQSDKMGSYPAEALPLELMGARLVSDGYAFSVNNYTVDESLTVDAPDFSIVTSLDRSTGDELITFSVNTDEPMRFYKIVDEDGPYVGHSTDFIIDSEESNPLLDADVINDVEVDGSRESTEEALDGTGISYLKTGETANISTGKTSDLFCLASDTPTSLLLGHYEGADYEEERIWINRQVVFCEDSEPYEAAYERTRNGYIIIDTSGIPEGSYVVENGNEDYFLNII